MENLGFDWLLLDYGNNNTYKYQHNGIKFRQQSVKLKNYFYSSQSQVLDLLTQEGMFTEQNIERCLVISDFTSRVLIKLEDIFFGLSRKRELITIEIANRVYEIIKSYALNVKKVFEKEEFFNNTKAELLIAEIYEFYLNLTKQKFRNSEILGTLKYTDFLQIIIYSLSDMFKSMVFYLNEFQSFEGTTPFISVNLEDVQNPDILKTRLKLLEEYKGSEIFIKDYTKVTQEVIEILEQQFKINYRKTFLY